MSVILGKAIIEITLPDGACPPSHLEGCILYQNSITYRFRWEYPPLFGEVSKGTEGKKWRPKGFINPYPDRGNGYQVGETAFEYLAFEAGATAMLEALRKAEFPKDIADAIKQSNLGDVATDWHRPNGQVVFIPDEEEQP